MGNCHDVRSLSASTEYEYLSLTDLRNPHRLMGVVQNFAGLVAARLALGIAEAGLFPGVILYLTLWYPRHLCQQRIAIFFR